MPMLRTPKWIAMLLVPLVLALSVVASGCGGGDDDAGSEQADESDAPAVTTSESETGETSKQVDSEQRDRGKDAGGEKEGDKEGSAPAPRAVGERRKQILDKAFSKASPRKRTQAVNKAMRVIFEGLRLTGAKASLSADRRTLTITVPASSVCTATRTDDATLTRGVKDILPFVRTVIAIVSPGGERLSAYAARCKPPVPPAGTGRVIYEKSGIGHFESPKFRVRSRRFAVEWAHEGGTIVVFVKKGKKTSPKAVGSHKSGGRQSYKGPGKFSLDITGDGEWTVRIRETS